eukprot:gene8394-11352_t
MDNDDQNDNEVHHSNAYSSQSQVNQTQPEVQTMYKDIFGDSDEEVEDDIPQNKSSGRSADLNTGDDDSKMFDDSDDDVFVSKGGRLQKKNTSTNIPQSKVTLENLIDSDDEIEPISSKNLDKDSSTRKRKRKEKRERREKKNNGKVAVGDQPREGTKGESGDEYDSGEDIQATHEDQAFIDSEDDDMNKDILKEYDQDNDRFDDERPMMMKKSSYSKKSGSGGGGGSSDSSYRNRDPSLLDPLSQALIDMKKPKTQDLSDSDKDRFAEKLLTKMSYAVEQDDILFRNGKPAVHKLRLLPSVQQAISMKQLQQVLLDKDLLGVLRDWIEPRDGKTLPLLTIRSAIYEMLLKLPCTSDHLKRVVNDKPPIGATIVALRKHKAETAENKRMLKEIMEKWSRPIFSKSVDVRRGGGPSLSMMNQGENSEIQQALREKYIDANRILKDSQEGSSSQRVSLDAAISGSQQMKKTSNERVKVAYSTGFIFTVQPEQKKIVKEDVWEKKLGGGGRMSLLKKIKDMKSNKSGTGVKTNPRAMDLSVSGSTKH